MGFGEDPVELIEVGGSLLGEPLEEGAWAVRVQVKPFVRWIWLGSLLMTFGGILAVLDSRYRRLKVRQARTTATAAAAS